MLNILHELWNIYAEKGFFIYGQFWIGDKTQNLEIWVRVPAPSFTSYGILKNLLKLPKFCKTEIESTDPESLNWNSLCQMDFRIQGFCILEM